MEMPVRHPLRILILLLLALIVIALIAGVIAPPLPTPRTEEESAMPLPPLTPAHKIDANTPFAAIVAYLDDGFTPTEVHIKKGEVVRFSNNSSHPLWITTSGTPYPGANTACNASSLDTCQALQSGDYWQFRFDTPGTWGFKDKDGGEQGVVYVQ